MQIEQHSLSQEKAKELWKEYREAIKQNKSDKFLQDMKKVYNQLKCGRKVVDINTIVERGGITKNFEPKIAIALASSKNVHCTYRASGKVLYQNSLGYFRNMIDIETAQETLPQLPIEHQEKDWNNRPDGKKRLTAPVPQIPASLRPKGKLKNYYVLCEVDKWKPEPPTDPFLLRRLTPNMFVVLAAWNLTDLEKAVMKGRV